MEGEIYGDGFEQGLVVELVEKDKQSKSLNGDLAGWRRFGGRLIKKQGGSDRFGRVRIVVVVVGR